MNKSVEDYKNSGLKMEDWYDGIDPVNHQARDLNMWVNTHDVGPPTSDMAKRPDGVPARFFIETRSDGGRVRLLSMNGAAELQRVYPVRDEWCTRPEMFCYLRGMKEGLAMGMREWKT